MAQLIHFTKMHGAGNDYIYVNALQYEINNPNATSELWSDRHKGIGGDGLVLIGKPTVEGADFSMRIFNADGSEAMMCGNASRCIGKYVYEKGLTHKKIIKLQTLSGIKVLNLNVDNQDKVVSVMVDMGKPTLNNPKQFHQEKDLPEGTFVSMGNPHYVIFVDDVNTVDIAEKGSWLENHAAFPERCNIEFAAMRPDGIRVRVWERGSGITMACGTGACATAVAASLTNRSSRTSTIVMDGGTLHVEWKESDNHVYLSGPAEFAFEGDIYID